MMVPAPYNVEDCCERLSSGISFNLKNKNVQHKQKVDKMSYDV